MLQQHLVVGCNGQVGSAVYSVLRDRGLKVVGIDMDSSTDIRADVIHICIPYSEHFIENVRAYLLHYLTDEGLVIVHSTVPMGTCCRIASNRVVHSPIRGVHPNLAKGITTFVKFFGGPRAKEAAEIFLSIGIKTFATPKASTTEALKLWSTTYYGMCIAFEKEVHRYCEENGLDFDVVYKLSNYTYNDGYAALGMSSVARPVLEHFPGKIGGHCVIPNAKLLHGRVADFILNVDDQQEKS
jgi:UDP-N-acetyl-D-mannosaminuronate dehydrogenase